MTEEPPFDGSLPAPCTEEGVRLVEVLRLEELDEQLEKKNLARKS